jgi:hypothetical protein
MPSYQIVFVGGGDLNREPMDVHCADDGQATRWAVQRDPGIRWHGDRLIIQPPA